MPGERELLFKKHAHHAMTDHHRSARDRGAYVGVHSSVQCTSLLNSISRIVFPAANMCIRHGRPIRGVESTLWMQHVSMAPALLANLLANLRRTLVNLDDLFGASIVNEIVKKTHNGRR